MNSLERLSMKCRLFLMFAFVFCDLVGKSETRIVDYSFRDHIYRTWSDWSTWSACSRSCGVGITVRTRICRMRLTYHDIPIPKACAGENIEYKLCEKQKCPSDEDFVSYQCSLHNGNLVGGKIILEWIPYSLNDNPCELQCQAKDRSRLYSFGKVIDGTECDSKSPAVCVNGRCMKIDCSGQLGMDGQLDMCGVCRGDNSTCVRYQNSYWGRPRRKSSNAGTSAADEHYDYNHIARIPSGATRIIIKESSKTNFLALMDKSGKIIINSNWRVSSPDVVNTSGTKFTYNRTSTGDDILSAPGPTKSDVFVLVLGSGDIPTVQYEYWYSKKAEHKYSDSRKKSQYYVGGGKDLPPALVLSSQRNKYNYEGYRSYYHRNQIVPSHSKNEQAHPNPSQSNGTDEKLLHENKVGLERTTGMTPSTLSPSLQNIHGYFVDYKLSSSTTKPDVTLNTNEIKSRHLPDVIPSPTSDGQLDSGSAVLHEITDNTVVALPNAKSLLETPLEKASLSKGGYISNAILPSENSDTISNKNNQGGRHQRILVTTPRTTTPKYSVLLESTHMDRRPPSHLKKHHYEIDNSLTNLSSTQLTFVSPQPCTVRPGVHGFRNHSRKGERSGTYTGNLDYSGMKEELLGYPAVRKFTYVKRKRNRKNNDKSKIFQKELSDIKTNRKKRKRKSNTGQCHPCSRVKNQAKNFCLSDFVLRITVMSLHEVKDETQFEIQVIQSYKNKIPILSREYLWRVDPCRCPRLHIGREYIVTGHSGPSGAARSGESRLYVSGKSFIRRYSQKRALSMLRLARDKNSVCKRFSSSEE